LLDLAAKAVALLLEQPNLAFDPALDECFSDFQEAKLPPNFSLEHLEGGQRHRHPRDKDVLLI
jgi:hypothetical protein